MPAIKEQRWDEVSIYTWSDLSSYKWEDFRIALMEMQSELEAQGVGVESVGTVAETFIETESQGVNIEQTPTVMRTTADMVVSIVVSDRDYKSEMISYLPLYERKSVVFNEVLTAYDREFRNLEQQLDVVERNWFLDTAIETLPIHERDLGIENVKGLNYVQRREQISARNRAIFDQTTEETIKSVAAAFSNGEVEINTTDTPGIFEIKFVGNIGIPDNIQGLKQALDVIIPAHLGLTYTYMYITWEMVSDQTWNRVSGLKWDELKEWDEVM